MIPKKKSAEEPWSRTVESLGGTVSFHLRRVHAGIQVHWRDSVQQHQTEHTVVFRTKEEAEGLLTAGDFRFRHAHACVELRRAFDDLFRLPIHATPHLEEVIAVEGFADHALSILGRIHVTNDETTILECLNDFKKAVGVDHAVFVSFIREDEAMESFRFFLACDPAWCIEYQEDRWYARDPWLIYGQNNTEPICASSIPAKSDEERAFTELAAKFGVRSAYIVPAPSSGSVSRIGILMLGSKHPGFFEAGPIGPLRYLARSLSMELHEWWVRKVREDVIETCRLTDEDLALLRCEREGLGSKEIAKRMGMTPIAVDSRFQRINAKFSMPTRKAAAGIAAEYGVI